MTAGGRSSRGAETLILGAGLTGLSAAYHVGKNCVVVEGANRPGGTAATMTLGAFQLDRGVHVLYFRDPSMLEWITREIGVSLVESQRRSAVWFDGKYIPFPLQFNLAAVPLSARLRLAASAAKATLSPRNGSPSPNMAEWAQANYGTALTQRFLAPYNEKVWGISFDQLTTEWMNGFVPQPSARSVLGGLLGLCQSPVGANATFYYPEQGGIGRLATALARRIPNIQYGKRLHAIDYRQRIARFSDGSRISYHHLVSTVPLADLVSRLEPRSSAPIENGRELHANPVTVAHVLVPRQGVGGGLHWIYTADPRIPYYRVSFPHAIGPANCPQGWSALTVEIGGEVADKSSTAYAIKESLKNMGLVNSSEGNAEVVWDYAHPGYVRYDRAWAETRQQVLDFLSDHGIIALGRYGRWEYSNMESALLQGRAVSRYLGPPTAKRSRRAPVTSKRIDVSLKRYFTSKYPARQSRMARLLCRRGETQRLQLCHRWLPQCEGMSILDAGCGDGEFLAQVLRGRPSLIRLEDLVGENVRRASARLQHAAAEISAATTDVRVCSDLRRYDVVVAIGLFDYDKDWNTLLRHLLDRAAGMVIADFPKHSTLHSFMRRYWLRVQGVHFESTDRSRLENWLRNCGHETTIAELPLQWMARISS